VLTGAVFEKKPNSSAAICSMLARRLKAAGVDDTLRAHGLRKGKIQHRVHKMGHCLEDVMQTFQIRTVAIGKRYVDRHAHYKL